MTSHAQADRTLEQRLALTEWLSAEELHAYQVPLLAKLLDHARRTTEATRLARYRPGFAPGDTRRIEWSRRENGETCERRYARGRSAAGDESATRDDHRPALIARVTHQTVALRIAANSRHRFLIGNCLSYVV